MMVIVILAGEGAVALNIGNIAVPGNPDNRDDSYPIVLVITSLTCKAIPFILLPTKNGKENESCLRSRSDRQWILS